MNVKHVIGLVLAAGGIGVAVGILLAPASGKETKAKLLEGTKKLASNLTGYVGELKGKVNSGIDEISRKSKEAINSGSEQFKV